MTRCATLFFNLENAMQQILAIDDDPLVLRSIQRVLELGPYEIATAANGKLGLALSQHCQFDLVILDLFMPEQDGFEVLKALKTRSPGIKTLVVSGNTDNDWLKIARHLGASEVLLKPLDPQRLLQTVQSLLSTTTTSINKVAP